MGRGDNCGRDEPGNEERQKKKIIDRFEEKEEKRTKIGNRSAMAGTASPFPPLPHDTSMGRALARS